MELNQRRGPWSDQEDADLTRLVNTHGASNWVLIANDLGSRSAKQCRERYHQNLKPSLKHEPITPEEGAQIERLVNEMGRRWAEIARRIPGRSDNAVKNWWNGAQNRKKRQDKKKNGFHSYGDHSMNVVTQPMPLPVQHSPRREAPSGTLPPNSSRVSLPALHFGQSAHGYPSTHGSMAYYDSGSLPSPTMTNSPRSDIMDTTGPYFPEEVHGSSYTTSPSLRPTHYRPQQHQYQHHQYQAHHHQQAHQHHRRSPVVLPPLKVYDSCRPRTSGFDGPVPQLPLPQISLRYTGSSPEASPTDSEPIPTTAAGPRLPGITTLADNIAPRTQLPTAPNSPASHTQSAREGSQPEDGPSFDKDMRMDVSSLLSN